jgi:glycerol uptake facilitator-like aquaporin
LPEHKHRPAPPDQIRRLAAEGIGTAFLLMAIVGSGIMSERLMEGHAGLTLLVNSIATGAALAALIIVFAPISGAHLNPAVTLSFAMRRALPWAEAVLYLCAQCGSAIVGVAIANLMFQEEVLVAATTTREGFPQLLGEFIATFGLVLVIWGAKSRGALAVAPVVGCYITSAYWFTSSTSFANPAVTLARAATDTFAGIHPASVGAFVLAQGLGALAATVVFAWLTASPIPSVCAETAEIDPTAVIR